MLFSLPDRLHDWKERPCKSELLGTSFNGRTTRSGSAGEEVSSNTPYPAGIVDLPQGFPLAADIDCSFSPEPQSPPLGSKPPMRFDGLGGPHAGAVLALPTDAF